MRVHIKHNIFEDTPTQTLNFIVRLQTKTRLLLCKFLKLHCFRLTHELSHITRNYILRMKVQ